MAKIATAHIEIKPVLNDEALQEVIRCIEQAVTIGYRQGVKAAEQARALHIGDVGDLTHDEVVGILRSLGHDVEGQKGGE